MIQDSSDTGARDNNGKVIVQPAAVLDPNAIYKSIQGGARRHLGQAGNHVYRPEVEPLGRKLKAGVLRGGFFCFWHGVPLSHLTGMALRRLAGRAPMTRMVITIDLCVKSSICC